MEEVRTTGPMVILGEKGKGIFTRILIIRSAVYDTVRTYTVLPLFQIKKFES